MLDSLLLNKSMEKILFFILLNSKCYATQLHHRLKTSLTPIQYALEKLEKKGVLVSHYEGKTRFFELNSSYPLMAELEALLKKAYTFLPPHEKKLYYSPTLQHRGKMGLKNAGPQTQAGRATLQIFWEKLTRIQTMCFSAKSKMPGNTGWNGLGKGTVEVKKIDDYSMTFHEKGSWVSEENKQMDFRNIFRWTYHPTQGLVSLEHLRFGPQNPVTLFDLIPVDLNLLESMDAHVCENDTYFGQVRCDKHFIQFNWRVIGPKKNEEIDYLYT